MGCYRGINGGWNQEKYALSNKYLLISWEQLTKHVFENFRKHILERQSVSCIHKLCGKSFKLINSEILW